MNKLFKTIILALAISFSAPSAYADDAANASQYIDDVATQAMSILNASVSEAQKAKKLESLIANYVDIPWIGKFVMGQNWRKATADQQKRYLKAYEDFILKSYTQRFVKYKGEGHKMLSARADGSDNFTIKMSITSGGQPVLVDYKVRKTGKSDFKIFDFNVEGVSLITTQRSEFNSIIQSKGIDYLIDQLASKSTKVAGNSR